jgi:hypothetical protein
MKIFEPKKYSASDNILSCEEIRKLRKGSLQGN